MVTDGTLKNTNIQNTNVCERGPSHLESWREAAHKEHRVLGVEVKQGVGAWSFTLLDELLLVGGALTGDGQEHLPVSTQPARAENIMMSPN